MERGDKRMNFKNKKTKKIISSDHCWILLVGWAMVFCTDGIFVSVRAALELFKKEKGIENDEKNMDDRFVRGCSDSRFLCRGISLLRLWLRPPASRRNLMCWRTGSGRNDQTGGTTDSRRTI